MLNWTEKKPFLNTEYGCLCFALDIVDIALVNEISIFIDLGVYDNLLFYFNNYLLWKTKVILRMTIMK